MATGRSNKLVGQTGEYLVAAELSRQGLIATTFTGNVPHYDIVASDEDGKNVLVQVKTGRSKSWQFNITNFCNITFKNKRQIVGKPKACPIKRLVVVFVAIENNGSDRFYVLTWNRLRDLMIRHHKNFLHKHKGTRPRRWDSLHSAIPEQTLRPYRDNWNIVEKYLR